MERADDILRFWFGEDDGEVSDQRLRLWFGGDRPTDSMIRSRFGDDVETALGGGYAGWRTDPKGALALLLLLDQFPRNIFRGTPRAYAGDGRACPLAARWVKEGRELSQPILRRAFFYMPLEHAEDRAIQDLSVRSFERLVADAPTPLVEICRGFLDYAVRHRQIIERFGRFPHRNRTLGRTSSSAEEAFLQQPGSSF